MAKPILMTKVKNAINKRRDNASFSLSNINVNCDKKGCSGFITNTDTGTTVYINTEPCQNMYMYRYADGIKDYRGYHNRWAHTFEELIKSVDALLDSSPAEKGDKRV